MLVNDGPSGDPPDCPAPAPGYDSGYGLWLANAPYSGGIDKSDRVQVLNNTIGPNVTAKHVDVKEGKQNGMIRGNTFNGSGIAGQHSADSWVDVKGSGYLLEEQLLRRRRLRRVRHQDHHVVAVHEQAQRGARVQHRGRRQEGPDQHEGDAVGPVRRSVPHGLRD
ncbi:hypothetical protein JNUCC0626_05210 [Lentzea sp. JNUCC 0626]|uniref:hypothetical protein n=1 Tax=Lentzea sp. JNUCC 0626 TaxID=3367513 RepID=UPI00374A0B2C